MTSANLRPSLPALFAIVTASLAFASPSAFAYEDGPSDPSSPAAPSAAVEPHRPTHWYGYQTLAMDGAALAFAIPGMMGSSGAGQGLGIASGLTYTLGAPIVHFAHGHVDKGFADIGLRLGLPALLGFVGGLIGEASYTPASCDETKQSFCGLDHSFGQLGAFASGAELGGILGIGAAIAIDASVLARERVRHATHHDDEASAPPRAPPRTAHVEPTFGIAPERTGGTRATLGLLGTF